MKKLQTILTILLAVVLLAGCAVSAATLPAQTPQQKLTAEEAQAIALADAGLTAEAVTGLRTEYDVDDGVPEYEVDFRSGDYEYDYHIHAETGAVRSRDKEYDPPKAAPAVQATEPVQETQPAPTEPLPTEPPAPEKITAEEAAAIALADAGLTADAVTGLRTEYDVDDGVPEYEVDFRSGDYEYDYHIHAETGAVRSREKEYDPPKAKTSTATQETKPAQQTKTVQETQPTQATKPAAPERISPERAESIALKHAGLARKDVTRLKTEYDVDDGVPEYEVEFRHGGLEYSYEIHAVTGKILDFEQDD